MLSVILSMPNYMHPCNASDMLGYDDVYTLRTSALVLKKMIVFGIELGSLEVNLVAIPERSSCTILLDQR